MNKLILLFLLLLPLKVSADDSGECGPYLKYTYKESNHTLTISGNGLMYHYKKTSNHSPWYAYRKEIETIVINNGISIISSFAFEGCSSLKSVTIPNSVTSIYEEAFSDCSSLGAMTLPDRLLSIGKYAFKGCSGLKSITIPSKITLLSEGVFQDCSSLTTVTFNDGLFSIGDYSFKGCTSLSSITFPQSLRSIGESTFDGCSSLNNVTLPEGITAIDYYGFAGSGITTINFPSSLTTIKSRAFYNCKNLTSIVIPNTVTTIENFAFSDCINLKTILLPKYITYIGSGTFSRCISLTSIEIPENVTKLYSYVFEDCKALSSVSIPKSVEEIDNKIFSGCDNLMIVNCFADNVPKTGKDVFTDAPIKNAVLYVPSVSVEAYKQALPWNNFMKIVALGSTPMFELKYMIDGQIYKIVEYEYGATITPEPTPDGNYTSFEWENIPTTMPYHDVTVNAKYSVTTYTLTYMIDNIVYKTVEYAYGEAIVPESTPDGDYASFEWLDLPSTMPNHSVTVNAKYTKKESGQQNGHKLIVLFKSGDQIAFVLKDKPEISFNGTKFVVKASNSTTEYIRSDIADFHFEQSASAIESIEYIGSDDVSIYDMSGHKLATLKGGSQEAAMHIIDSYKPGMYIIKIGNQRTIKYLKK